MINRFQTVFRGLLRAGRSEPLLQHVFRARIPVVALATPGAPHIRDTMNLTRAMNIVLVALIPCIVFGIYNTGYQANVLITQAKLQNVPHWHGIVIDALGIGYSPAGFVKPMLHGLFIFLPVLAVTLITGGIWEAVFVRMRGGGRRGDYVLICLLFSLSLPPAVPLWQVFLGVSFGIVVGKEIFGGTGKHFMNPTLVGLAFLYITYPAQMVGETAWAVHGLSGATPMKEAVDANAQQIAWIGSTWLQSFLGLVPGAIGATSTLACLLGTVLLIGKRILSWRIITGVLIGMIVTVVLFNQFGDPSNAFAQMSWHWHLVLGSFAFATVFLATDPASAAMTDTGRWIYGLLVGAMLILIRVMNPAHPDGVMFAILFANIMAPLIDYGVIYANILRRRKRSV
jgi:Na+-transporting NADH:ubiquinone oxidoreductase subunit B